MNGLGRQSSRILIVKLSAVGDVVHTLPALNTLRLALPEAHIGWAVQRGAHNLLEGHPQIDELIVLPRRRKSPDGNISIRKLKEMIRGRGGWDVAIDFQGLTKSGVVACLSRAPKRIGLGNKWSRELNGLFINQKITPAAVPVIQMNMELLQPLIGAIPGDAVAVLPTTPADDRNIQAWLQSTAMGRERFLVLDPFAGWETKLWDSENWVNVALEAGRQFQLPSLVVHGPGEEQRARDLVEQVRLSGADCSLAPQTTLREYGSLLRQAAGAFVGADTGPMHIAAAVGIPTVAIFGPSDSRRNSPTFSNARFRVLQDFSQPCAGTFARKCQHHPPGKCMSSITPEQVLSALGEMLLK